jgi:hypothetical protein
MRMTACASAGITDKDTEYTYACDGWAKKVSKDACRICAQNTKGARFFHKAHQRKEDAPCGHVSECACARACVC